MPEKYYSDSELMEMDGDELDELVQAKEIEWSRAIGIKAQQTGQLDDGPSLRIRAQREAGLL